MKTFKKIRKSLIAFLLALVLVVPVTACDKGGKSGSAKLSDVEFWGTYSSESILQDLHGVYNDFKFEPTINISVARGEEEGGKIIMTTGDKAVTSFDVSITSLKSGENTLDKENIDLYQSMYTYLGSKEFYKYEGFYPDGLAPIAGAKVLGQNVIAPNQNQGIYTSFNIPIDQEPGVYTGSLVITIADEDKVIPVTVTVYDATVPEETDFWSSWSIGWGHERGELDTTFEMRGKYANALKDHRLGTNVLLTQYSHNLDTELAAYGRFLLEYFKDPKAVSIGFPGIGTKKVDKLEIVYPDGYVYTINNATVHEEEDIYFWYGGVARIALNHYMETGETVNVFERMYQKGIDEPDLWNALDTVPTTIYSFQVAKKEVVKELTNDESIPLDVRQSQYFKDLMASLLEIDNLISTWTPVLHRDPSDPLKTPENGYVWDPEIMSMIHYPHYNECGSASLREKFRSADKDRELWWYGCDVPTAPFPTYHLGNHALSMRIGDWMAADYDIIGNTNWATNRYKISTNPDGTDYMEDYYDTGVRSNATPGEGWLWYPGKMYGVDGPIPTLRIKEMKNGIEEWEMIRKLGRIYDSKGYDEANIMAPLYASMYSASKIFDTITCELFYANREKLLQLLTLAESDAQVMITDYSDVRGQTIYEVFVADGYTLGSGADDDVKISNKFDVKETKVNGGTLYSIVCHDEDNFTLTLVEEDGTVKSISFGLEIGQTVFTPASEFYANDGINEDNVSAGNKTKPETLDLALVDATVLNPAEEMAGLQYVQIKIGDAQKRPNNAPGKQSFIINDELVKDIDKNVDKVELEIFYAGNDELPILFTYKGRRTIAQGVEGTLKYGMNRIQISGIKGLNWNSIGQFEYLLVELGNEGDLARSNVYLVGITIYR